MLTSVHCYYGHHMILTCAQRVSFTQGTYVYVYMCKSDQNFEIEYHLIFLRSRPENNEVNKCS